MQNDIQSKIIQAVKAHIQRDLPRGAVCLKSIDLNTKIEDLAIDSLGLIEFVAGVEDEFDVTITGHECIKSETIGDYVDLVISKVTPALRAA